MPTRALGTSGRRVASAKHLAEKNRATYDGDAAVPSIRALARSLSEPRD